MQEIPKSFDDPVPVDFFIGLMVASIVFLSVILMLVICITPITYCTLEVRPKVKLYSTLAVALVSGIFWFVSINGVVGPYLYNFILISDEIFTTLNTVVTTIDSFETCVGNRTDTLDLNFALDIETEFDKYRGDVSKWHKTTRNILISLYTLLGVGCITFPYLIYRGWRTTKLIFLIVMGILLFIVFITLVPLSNVGYSGLYYVCGDNIEGHNEKINKLIGRFDDTVNQEQFCSHRDWRYLCDVQMCSGDGPLLDNVISLEDLQQSNLSGSILGGCDYEYVEQLVIDTIENTLSCNNIRGYYDRFVDEIVCTEFHELFVYTLWPVGFATVFTTIMFIIGFMPETDYVLIEPIEKMSGEGL